MSYAVRIHFSRASVGLHRFQAFTDVAQTRFDWNLPFRYAVPVALAVPMSITPAVLWAGALTPVQTLSARSEALPVPSYANVSLIKEYPSEINQTGPFLRTTKGYFGYSVGVQMTGDLLSSAGSTISIDGSIRTHAKLDKTRYTYIGRSYGVGSSAGLVDDAIINTSSILGYAYIETGYKASVVCLYNSSSDFVLEETQDTWVYAAIGTLPDSNAGGEYSSYIGHSVDSIVAIGVAHIGSQTTFPLPVRRYLAFAAGSTWGFLDQIQCTVDFIPSNFQVNVNVVGQNITVAPMNNTVKDVDPTRSLSTTVLRQFELIANDETNLPVSAVGSAFNSSITDVRTARPTIDVNTSTLIGVENAITAVVNDMLGAYASAQLMVANFSTMTPMVLQSRAYELREVGYVIAVLVVSLILMLIIIYEAVRTHGWRELLFLNLMDLRHTVAAASNLKSAGVEGFADEDQEPRQALKNFINSVAVRLDAGIGKFIFLRVYKDAPSSHAYLSVCNDD